MKSRLLKKMFSAVLAGTAAFCLAERNLSLRHLIRQK